MSSPIHLFYFVVIRHTCVQSLVAPSVLPGSVLMNSGLSPYSRFILLFFSSNFNQQRATSHKQQKIIIIFVGLLGGLIAYGTDQYGDGKDEIDTATAVLYVFDPLHLLLSATKIML